MRIYRGLDSFVQTGSGAVTRSLRDKERDGVSVFDFMTATEKTDVIAETLSVDVTTSIQAALDAHQIVVFPDGAYKITDKLTLDDGHHIRLGSGVLIQQFTADTNIFYALQKDSITLDCGGAILYGEGAWSNAWVGNGGHEDKAINFLGCTNTQILAPHVRNCAASGIAIIGGDARIIAPIVEGTHNYSTALSSGDNYQNGIYIVDDTTYGNPNVAIVACDVSGTAQGILREVRTAGAPVDATLQIVGGRIHDIPGQHATYIQSGAVSIVGLSVANIALGAVKFSSNVGYSANYSAVGVTGEDVTGQLFEVECTGSGTMHNVEISGHGYNCGTGLTLSGPISNVRANVAFENIGNNGNALEILGAGPSDHDISIHATTVGQDAVLVVATSATNIKIRPTIRQCGQAAAGTYNGVTVNSASAQVELIDPIIEDTDGNMLHGISCVTNGSTIRVRGSVRIKGSSGVDVSMAGGYITEWPTDAQLLTTGDVTRVTTDAFAGYLSKITGAHTLVLHEQSTSSTNKVVWIQEIPVNSVWRVIADVVGRKSDGTQYRMFRTSRMFRRDAGNVVNEGGPTSVLSVAGGGGGTVTITDPIDVVESGSFAGVYSWDIDTGTQTAMLKVNSGGATTYDWEVRITTISVP